MVGLPLLFSRLNLSLWILAAPYLTAGPEVDAVELFRTRVQPVLAARCFACHTTQRAGGLDMGSRELLLKGGNSGPAIVPGHPERSLLIQSVQHTHERLKMPLSGSKLEEQEISDLISWVRAGAVWLSGSADTTQEGASYSITEDQRAFNRSPDQTCRKCRMRADHGDPSTTSFSRGWSGRGLSQSLQPTEGP